MQPKNPSTPWRWRILFPKIYIALSESQQQPQLEHSQSTVASINSKHWELFINLLHDSVIDMRIKSYDAAIPRLLIGISR